MHLSPNLFSFIVLMKLLIALAQSDDQDAIYFPTDSEENSQNFHPNKQNSTQSADLASLGGTRIDEKFVNKVIINGVAKLTIDLDKLMTSQAQRSNVLYSPVNIAGALALLLLGSNGVTFKELSELMGLAGDIPDLNTKTSTVHEQFAKINKIITTSHFDVGQHIFIANALFIQTGYPIRPLYKSSAQELYHTDIINVDFQQNSKAAQDQINQWVEQTTNGTIKTILNELPPSYTKVILSSVLYFRAEWKQHFFPGNTKRRPFYVNGRNSPSLHETDMMANGGHFPYYEDLKLGCEILGLPYKGENAVMYIIMPFNSSQERLHEFELNLTPLDLERLVSRTEITETAFLFPKMRIESSVDLKKYLEMLGVQSLFNSSKANLALLTPGEGSAVESKSPETLDDIRKSLNRHSTDNNSQNPGLYVEQVTHKVYMDITEKGTEAGAATAVSITKSGKVIFRVDVPFIFFIRHEETKTILFWGSVVLPTPNYQTV